jgi:sigma-B regulation protein RsbU (phosphoserine phosphatase)
VRIQLLLMLMAVMLPAQSLDDARMARGDDPRWADPAFDDRGWETVARRRVRPMEDAKENRFWLRMRVTVPDAVPGEPAAVSVFGCPCEVFLDGVRLGATGDLNAARPQTTNDLTVFPVPAALGGRSAVLAVRLYNPPGREAANEPFSGRIRLLPVRDGGRVAAERQEVLLPYVVRLIFAVLALGGLLAAALGQRNDPLILGMLGYVCSVLANAVLILFPPTNSADNYAWVWLVVIPVTPLLVFVQWQLAGLPIQRNWVAALLAGYLVLRIPWYAGLFLAKPAPWTPLAAGVFLIPSVVDLGLASYAAARGWPRSPRPVRFLMAAVVTTFVINLITRLAGQGWIPGLLAGQVSTVVSLAFTIFATAYIIRTGRERRAEQERLRSEMESAQTVQALLLNQALPAEVEAIYFPASEVGGDFYQVLERADGSRVVLVGDVSGKGLKAAMLVSATIGMLRREKSSSPGAILAGLNDALAGHTGGGFVTCCCARFGADGTVTIANAGHPSPYCDGREAEAAAGLPLGVVAGVAYEESVVPGERFTFVSDGVVEAENAQRELFGFDRTREISTKSAQEIAEAAKAWGQNDDITVVTVRRNS